LQIELSADANSDLRSVHAYTVREHGRERAALYLSGLRARFDVIAASPRIGRIFPEATPETWRAPYRKHFVSYRVEGDVLLIVRVLHQRMLQEGRLT
jgi:toxin ParE1/3/4